jgi:hypothetical protein
VWDNVIGIVLGPRHHAFFVGLLFRHALLAASVIPSVDQNAFGFIKAPAIILCLDG